MPVAGKIGAIARNAAALAALIFAVGAPARATIQAKPSSLSFGSLSVGSTSAPQRVTLTNGYRRSVTIYRIFSLTAQFSVSGVSLPATLEPGRTLTIYVTFKPSAAETYSSRLEVLRVYGWPTYIPLGGTGTAKSSPPPPSALAPTIMTQPASAKIIAGQTATFRVAASGTAPLTYQWKKNGAAIGGATSPTYTTPAETSADNNAQFSVSVSNSAGGATSGTATLTVSPLSVILNPSASSMTFGSVNLSSSSSRSITLTNAGNSNVTISNVSVSGAGFNASGLASGLILAPGQAATLTATFAPSASGSATGSVSVASNATNSPDVIGLSGTGVAAVNHSVSLSWSPTTSAVVGYNAYVSQQSGGPYAKLTGAPVAGTSYTDTAVQAGQTYYFVVTSVDSNSIESAYSAEVSALVP